MYHLYGERPLLLFGFRCEIEEGEPAAPGTEEVEHVDWFMADELPAPMTRSAYVIADALAGAACLVRTLPRDPPLR